jgi:hypothetical protein
MTDPVCARLAMCLMDEDYRKEIPQELAPVDPVDGMNKKWWTTKLREIFSSGLVSPAKGDFGEVVVALYMLFCGDLLRKSINNKDTSKQPYSQFSVPLDAWLQLMVSGGGNGSEVSFEESKVSLGFIQFGRNSLRSYAYSWTRLKDQPFLKHIYESGIAFYTYQACPLIDMVVPLRIRKVIDGDDVGDTRPGTEYEYVPMLISVKCQQNFSQKQAQDECNAMKERAETANMNKAVCLLIVFGSNEDSQYSGDIGMIDVSETVSGLVLEGVVSKAIRIPSGDVFGLTAAFNDMTPTAQVETELITSHPFLMGHGPDVDENDDLKAENALRRQSSKRWTDEYNDLRDAMTTGDIKE